MVALESSRVTDARAAQRVREQRALLAQDVVALSPHRMTVINRLQCAGYSFLH